MKKIDSGIGLIGNLPWGTHFCQFYQSQKDLLDILIPYFKAGLENNELCVLITSEFFTKEEAILAFKKKIPAFSKYLKKGQMEIFPYTDWYLKSGKFEMEKVLKMWLDKHNQALSLGFKGLRVSGNPFWIDNKKDWNDFAAYEAEINNVIGSYNLLVLCTYSLNKCQATEIIDVVTNHEFALIKRSGSWHLIESAEQKRAKEVLRQQEEALIQAGKEWEKTFDSAPDLIAILDTQHRIVRANKAMAKRLRTLPNQCIGLNCFKCVHKLNKPLSFCPHSKTLADGKKHTAEIHEDNLGGDFLISTTPLFDQEGKITGSVHVAHDITDRKKAEKEIAHLASFPRLNLNPIAEIDLNGNVIYANPAFINIFPNIKREGIEHPMLAGIDPKVIQRMKRPSLIREVFVEKKWYKQTATYVSEVDSVRVYNTDITDRKRLEEQKDEFIGVATHELKTPVTSIKAYSQVLQKIFHDKGDINSEELLAKMNGQVNKLIELITDLLDITKIQTGKLRFSERHFDFNEMANEIVEEVQRISFERKIVIEFDRTKTVYGDRDRIGQVITNFLTNAIKYSSHKEKVIVKTRVNQKYLAFYVKDFGIGIPKQKQNKVFERFYRVRETDERTPTGLGLGLYISSEIIKRHKGEIGVKSSLNKGSTFYFNLPLINSNFKK